jgi:wyosine [tRNA(Phe)-imidazoG37] synthetase (radical SAM superfamily)
MARHLFGPVPSRRLGRSLGIDLTPDTACTLNCVYCECGTTRRLTVERDEFVPTAEVLRELDEALAGAPELDSITFSGSGEPTLHTGIGRIIAHLKDRYPAYRVTVLTNATLLGLPDVRAALGRADLVVPSLDAVSEAAFRRINRPHPSLASAALIDGLRAFRRDFPGELWLEVFIVPGVNDTDEELALFRDTIATLGAQRVQLNTLDRPGAVAWIQPAPLEYLQHLASRLGSGVEVVASRRAPAAAGLDAGTRELLLATAAVRACTLAELAALLAVPPATLGAYLDQLIGEGAVLPQRSPEGITYIVPRG